MKRILSIAWLLVSAWLALPGNVLAQGGWDLSGSWKSEPTKSKGFPSNSNPASPQVPAPLPPPGSGPIERIEQDLGHIKITRGSLSYELVAAEPETVTSTIDGREYRARTQWDGNRLVTDWRWVQDGRLLSSGKMIRYLSKEGELLEDNSANVGGALLETQEVFTRVADQPAALAAQTPQEMLDQAASAAAAGLVKAPSQQPGMALGGFNSSNAAGSAVILSDTKGVDFGPYLARIMRIVRTNWYAMMPESARLGAQGRVAIRFAIERDGSVQELKVAESSGSKILDTAAARSVVASAPFPTYLRNSQTRNSYCSSRFFTTTINKVSPKPAFAKGLPCSRQEPDARDRDLRVQSQLCGRSSNRSGSIRTSPTTRASCTARRRASAAERRRNEEVRQPAISFALQPYLSLGVLS